MKKRKPEAPNIIIRPGQGAPGSVSRVRPVTVCRYCGREVSMTQVKERYSGRLPILWRCPKHGTLYLEQVSFGLGG